MTLYAVHIQGPDDIIATPGKREAELLADKLNAWLTQQFKEPYLDAVVVKWPGTKADHAKQLAEDWEQHAKFIGPIELEPERDTRTIDMFQEQAS